MPSWVSLPLHIEILIRSSSQQILGNPFLAGSERILCSLDHPYYYINIVTHHFTDLLLCGRVQEMIENQSIHDHFDIILCDAFVLIEICLEQKDVTHV